MCIQKDLYRYADIQIRQALQKVVKTKEMIVSIYRHKHYRKF